MPRTLLIATAAAALLAAGATSASAATVSVSDASVTEGSNGAGGTAAFSVQISQSFLEGGVSWSLGLGGGTATPGTDYSATPSVASDSSGLCLSLGGCTKTTPVTASIVGDNLDEPDETFGANATATGATVSHQGTITINDDDNPPFIEVGGDSRTEGNAGSSDAKGEFELSAPSGRDVTVHYETQDGTATQGSDYAYRSGTVTIPAGNTEASVHIPVFGDTTFEPDEDFRVHAFGAVNAVLSDDEGRIRILNDDAPPPPPPAPAPPSSNHGGSTTPNPVVVTVNGAPVGQTISQQGGSGAAGSGSGSNAADESGPRMRIAFAGLANHGKVARLRLTCPRDEQTCAVTVRTRAAGHPLAQTRFVIAGGQTAALRLALTKAQRRLLRHAESLTVRAVARDAAGNSEAVVRSFAI